MVLKPLHSPILLGYLLLEVLELLRNGPAALLGLHVVEVHLAGVALVLLPGALAEQQLQPIMSF